MPAVLNHRDAWSTLNTFEPAPRQKRFNRVNKQKRIALRLARRRRETLKWMGFGRDSMFEAATR